MAVVALFFLLFSTCPAQAAGPKVHVVVASQAEALETFAADEMAGQLKKLFEADVVIGDNAPDGADNVILLGNPATHDVIKDLNLALPKLSDQGHALKSVTLGDTTVLVVAGGSPRAVIWAAYELGWKFGIRYFSFGDLYPATTPVWTLTGFDTVINGVDLGWAATRVPPFALDSDGLNEIEQLLRQLLKQGYSSVVWNVRELESGKLFGGTRFAVAGDTVGRSAFKGEKWFDNPNLARASSESDRAVHGKELVERLLKAGKQIGIDVEVSRLSDGGNRVSILPSRSEVRDLPVNRLDDLYTDKTVEVFREALLPICGDGVAERVTKAVDLCDRSYALIKEHDPSLSLPERNMFLRHFESDEPPPGWWGEVRDCYLNAMNEMYRANTRARQGGRQFTLWYARRFEFGFEYMNAVEAVRKAGIAKRKGNKDEQIAELEKALDSITNACNAMAAVARSQSDRGVIAVMNEYGYRPVTKLLEEADAGN